MGAFQAALQELVTHAPGTGQRGVDLQRSLGLDKKLAWQVSKLIRAVRPLSEVAHVPPRSSMERLVAAGENQGIAEDVLNRVNAAFESFERFVEEHGGDRAEMISLAGGLLSEHDPHHDLQVRRNVFRGNAHLWGIKLETVVFTNVFHSGGLESVTVGGHIGIQRLRPGVSFSRRVQADPPAFTDPTKPLTPPEQQGVRILEEFSTHPLPTMTPHTNRDGSVETEIEFPPSGRRGAVTLYTVNHLMGKPGGQPRSSHVTASSGVSTPTEMLVTEMLVPQGMSDPATARVAVYGRRTMVDQVGELRTIDLLPQRETVAYMGTLESSPPVPGVPQHATAVRHVLEKLGWLNTKYDVYRCRVQYPLLHSLVHMAVEKR